MVLKDTKRSENSQSSITTASANPDPITGETGAHPVGTGVGTALGGALTGVAAGAVGGPVGAAIGAIAGGIAGAYAGKSIAEELDPSVEDAYWRTEYRNRDYYNANVDYDRIAPVYRYGWEFEQAGNYDRFEDAESQAQSRWENEGGPDLPWERVRPAFRDSWERTRTRRSAK